MVVFLGFRFLRAIRIMNTPDILQYMGLIERPRTIRIVQLASRFIAVWFAAAGAVHLAENSGDFFCKFENAQELDVFNAIYFMIVTMTTVTSSIERNGLFDPLRFVLGWLWRCIL